METIEERAQQSAGVKDFDALRLKTFNFCFQTGYIEGATDQREIDIQRAVEWLKEKCYDDSLYSFDIDEFEQAMKGE